MLTLYWLLMCMQAEKATQSARHRVASAMSTTDIQETVHIPPERSPSSRPCAGPRNASQAKAVGPSIRTYNPENTPKREKNTAQYEER